MTKLLNIYRIAVLLSIVAIPVSCIFDKEVTLAACIIGIITMGSYMIGGFICYLMPYSWTCDWAGTHRPSAEMTHDAVNSHSNCYKCNKEIMIDSQGNWF